MQDLRPRVRIQSEAIDMASEDALLATAAGPAAGARVGFSGQVRATHEASLEALWLEHYPGMTERLLLEIAEEAQRRWSVLAVTIVHRVGLMQVGDLIVWVGVASAHRQEALTACACIMDRLKTEAPFWKKEISSAGESWVEARASDERARQRWVQEAPARRPGASD